jgi:hypothetical protein
MHRLSACDYQIEARNAKIGMKNLLHHSERQRTCDLVYPVNIPTRPSPNTMRIFLKSVAMRSCE